MSTIIKYGSSGAWLNYNGKVLNANATTIPPLTYRGPFDPSNGTNTFEYAYSDEVGWPYISSEWK